MMQMRPERNCCNSAKRIVWCLSCVLLLLLLFWSQSVFALHPPTSLSPVRELFIASGQRENRKKKTKSGISRQQWLWKNSVHWLYIWLHKWSCVSMLVCVCVCAWLCVLNSNNMLIPMALKFIVWLQRQRKGEQGALMQSSFWALHYSTQGLITSRLNQGYHFLFRLCTSVWLPNKGRLLFCSFLFSFRFRDVSPEAEPCSRCCRCCWVGTVGCFFLFVVFVPESEVWQVDSELWPKRVGEGFSGTAMTDKFTVYYDDGILKINKPQGFDTTTFFLSLIDCVFDLTSSRFEMMIWCWLEASSRGAIRRQ